MGFFSDIGKSINKVVKPIIKDAVPIAAAVATGGQSLAVLKPTNTLDRLDKITGLPTSQFASMMGPTGALGALSAGQPQTTSQETVSPAALTQPQQGQSVYDMITPYLNSFLQSSQKTSSDVQPNANYLAAQPVQQAQSSGPNMMLILGGLGALLVGAFLIFRRK